MISTYLILISATWPAWFLAVPDDLLHFAMSRPLEMPPWHPSPWQPLCLWHQYHHSTANGRAREGEWESWHSIKPPVQFRRRCNLCNFGDCACQDEHDDFCFNKHVKRFGAQLQRSTTAATRVSHVSVCLAVAFCSCKRLQSSEALD